MTPDQLIDRLRRERAVAILRTRLAEAAAPAMQAAIRGGFRVVEVTMGTPGALELVAELSRHDDLVVGAGTVLEVAEVRAAAGAGAAFLVSPVFDEEVVQEAQRLGVAIIPGVHTPAEMLRAHRAGARPLKLFPAPAGGPDYLRACLGPLPFLELVPTNGVDAANAAAWLAAGALAVGFAATLFADEPLRTGRFELIEQRARDLLHAVATAPAGA